MPNRLRLLQVALLLLLVFKIARALTVVAAARKDGGPKLVQVVAPSALLFETSLPKSNY